jgi:hypothetical protein
MKYLFYILALLVCISISPVSAAVNHYTETDGSYNIEIFNGSGSTTFTYPTSTGIGDYLVVAGGGAGGGKSAGNAGGGGAGGFVNGTNYNFLPGGTYTINVGAGGLAVTSSYGLNGGGSWISNASVNISATGGGGGGQYRDPNDYNYNNGRNGGSGGGSSQASTEYPSGGTGISGQGYNGGHSLVDYTWSGAGGGGANEIGGNPYGANGRYGGKGGAGCSTSIMGYSIQYAGGGSGSSNAAGGDINGMGGVGGGGNGRYGTTQATAGTDGLGGGGGGGGETSYDGKNGGSGIVIIRYQVAAPQSRFSIMFVDNSTGATSWQWNATNLTGNNTPVTFSTSQNPSPILFNPGNYLINLTVTNTRGSNSTIKTVGINLTMPVVHFWNRTG